MNFLPGEGLRPLTHHNKDFYISNFGRVFSEMEEVHPYKLNSKLFICINVIDTQGMEKVYLSDLMEFYWKEVTDTTKYDEKLATWKAENTPIGHA